LSLTVDIVWPGGQKETVVNIKPNQSIVVQEGKGVTSSAPIVFVPIVSPSPSPTPGT